MRTLLFTSILFLATLVMLVPGASADAGLRDCAAVDTSGDPITVTVSPSGCYEVGRPVWNIWNAECRWLMQSPHWPDEMQCNDQM